MSRRIGFVVTAVFVLVAWSGPAQGTIRVARSARRRDGADDPASCGPAWTEVASPDVGELEGVVAVSSTNAWAVGSTAESPSTPMILHWDGGTWTDTGAPAPVGGRLLGVTTVGTKNAWAVGYDAVPGKKTRTLVEHGTAKGWKVVKTPSADRGDAFTGVSGTATDDVWAVGTRTVGKNADALIEHYDGGAWSVSDTSTLAGRIQLTGVRAVSPTDVWAVGSKVVAGGRTITFAAHWDGTSWAPVKTPDASNLLDELRGIGGAASDDLWAVGDTLSSLSGPTITSLTEHWDGTQWRIVASPNPTTTTYLYGVAPTTAGHDVAVGATDAFRSPVPFEWDGTQWNEQTTPETNDFLVAVAAAPSGPVWAVGQHTAGQTLIEESCPTP